MTEELFSEIDVELAKYDASERNIYAGWNAMQGVVAAVKRLRASLKEGERAIQETPGMELWRDEFLDPQREGAPREKRKGGMLVPYGIWYRILRVLPIVGDLPSDEIAEAVERLAERLGLLEELQPVFGAAPAPSEDVEGPPAEYALIAEDGVEWERQAYGEDIDRLLLVAFADEDKMRLGYGGRLIPWHGHDRITHASGALSAGAELYLRRPVPPPQEPPAPQVRRWPVKANEEGTFIFGDISDRFTPGEEGELIYVPKGASTPSEEVRDAV